MPKNLVIVESPAKSKTIEKFLWKDYKVVASMGHIRDLPVKSIWVDIKNGFKPEYEVSKEKTKTVNELKKLAKTSEEVWIATDEDREWEAIWWHLCNVLDLDPSNTKRIVFHEITKKAITNSIKSPRNISLDLVDAQQARRVLDRLVWYKVSPVLWKKIRKGLSAWRVQSVSVKLVVEKEREIQNFKPEESWKISAVLEKDNKKFTTLLTKQSGKTKKIKTEEDAQKFLSTLWIDLNSFKISEDKKWNKLLESNNKITFIVDDVKEKEAKRLPAAPFTTSTLQQEASRKFGFTLKRTMMIAQKLYEWVDLWNGAREGLITYMRTDSLNLSAQAISESLEVIKERYWDNFATSSGRKYKTKWAGAQEAHEAIRPVSLHRTPEILSSVLDSSELKLYSLIWKRTIASQMKEAKVNITTVLMSPENHSSTWQSKGEVITFEWFMKAYMEWKDDDEENSEDNSILPPLCEWEKLISKEIISKQSFTRPPARYTEASLVKKLESEWIGRPSTYAPTITTVIDRGYIEKFEKRYLKPTDIAFMVNDFLDKYFPNMMDYKFTSTVETDLDKVAAWEEKYEEMLWEFYKTLDKELKEADSTAEKVVEKVGKKCPKCDNDLVYKFSKWGKFIWCSNYPDCDFIDRLEDEKKEISNLEERYKDKKCGKCRSNMIIKTGRYWPFLACSSYPECKNIESIKDPKQEILEAILEEKWLLVDEETWAELVVKNSKRWLFLAAKEYPKVKIAKPIPKDVLEELKNRT